MAGTGLPRSQKANYGANGVRPMACNVIQIKSGCHNLKDAPWNKDLNNYTTTQRNYKTSIATIQRPSSADDVIKSIRKPAHRKLCWHATTRVKRRSCRELQMLIA